MFSLRFFFFIFFIAIRVSAFALYNGNPSLPMMPETGAFIPRECWFGLKAGYECDFVYDRKLHMDGHHLGHCSRSVPKFESLSNFGVVTFNFNDRVEIFADLGSMSSEISHRPYSNTTISYQTSTHFTWGVGGRAILAYWGDLQLSANATYIATDSPLYSLKVNGESYSTRHAAFDLREWQIGIGISWRFKWIIPYIGADFSDFRARIDHLNSINFLIPGNHITVKDSYPCGIFLGVGLSPTRAMNVNFEARFINENAVAVSADFKF